MKFSLPFHLTMIYIIFHRGKSTDTEFGSSVVYQHCFAVLSIERLYSHEELGIGEVISQICGRFIS